jgi:hypothetical protein
VIDCYCATIDGGVGIEKNRDAGREKHGWAGIGLVHRLSSLLQPTFRVSWTSARDR